MEWEKLLCADRIRPNYKKPGGGGDMRTEYEKDYHRIIGSASFRRLQDKTQVFPLDNSDFIRTRLTHSLEVSSFCKSLGQNISQKILNEKKDESFLPEYQGYICDILQCAGLLHDIGNPPFGHFGETAIQDWFREHLPEIPFPETEGGPESVSDGEGTAPNPVFPEKKGAGRTPNPVSPEKAGAGRTLAQVLDAQMREDFYHFEGNAQAFRLVTKLHYLVDVNGMNLTKALLGTIIKYPGSSLEIKKDGPIRHKKMGYFYGDREAFREVQRSLGTDGNRHPLAFVLEAADDIAYKTADIEDAVKKGCISYHRLLEELKQYGAKIGEEDKRGAYERYVASLERKYERARQRELQQAEMNAVQNWCVSVQGWMINDASSCFVDHYEAIMEGSYGSGGEDLFYGTGGYYLMKALGDIAYRYAFQSKPILKLEIAAQSIFDFLLEKFVDAAVNFDTGRKLTAVQEKMMALVSDNYKAIYRHFAEGKGPVEKLYLRLLLVTDTVCGMTDGYAKRLYQELKGID